MGTRLRVALCVALVVACATFALATPRSTAPRQGQDCVAFRALIQASLFPDDLLRPEDVWGGEFIAYLGGEFLRGYASMNDGTVTYHGVVGMGHDTNNLFRFSSGDTVILTSTHSTFPDQPAHGAPPGATAQYQASAKVLSGTGKFANATGNFTITGPALVFDLDKVLPHGRWNGELKGQMCGVVQ